MKKCRILQSEITNASYAAILQEIVRLAISRQSSYVCIANVHMVIEAYRDAHFRRIVNEAAIATTDGKPLAVFMNLLHQTDQERVAGPDLMLDLFKAANDQNLSVFFYGATEEVLDVMRHKLEADYSNLKIAGMLSPPFRSLTPEEDAHHTAAIQASGAELVFVALGCPKQEYWMAVHKDKINAVMIGVGAAFPFYTGQLKRSPRWMQDWCLEWLYRLYVEPRRLFKRYLVTNSLFLVLMARQLLVRFARLKCSTDASDSNV